MSNLGRSLIHVRRAFIMRGFLNAGGSSIHAEVWLPPPSLAQPCNRRSWACGVSSAESGTPGCSSGPPNDGHLTPLQWAPDPL